MTALAAGVDPAAGLVAAIVVIAAAGLAFAAQRGTEPTTTGERDARARRRLGPPRSGALAYGAIAWRIAARRRFVTAVAAFAAATALTALLGYRTFPVAGRDTLTRAPRTVVSPDRDDVTGRGGHTVPEDPAVGDRPSDG
ncbi:MAG TPA: hypothetical protein VI300_13345 [Solirubrobacter sp.]